MNRIDFEGYYKPGDTDKIDHAIACLQRESCTNEAGLRWLGVHMKCFNRQEAEELCEYCEKKHPGIAVAFSYLALRPGGLLYTTGWRNRGKDNEVATP